MCPPGTRPRNVVCRKKRKLAAAGATIEKRKNVLLRSTPPASRAAFIMAFSKNVDTIFAAALIVRMSHFRFARVVIELFEDFSRFAGGVNK